MIQCDSERELSKEDEYLSSPGEASNMEHTRSRKEFKSKELDSEVEASEECQ